MDENKEHQQPSSDGPSSAGHSPSPPSPEPPPVDRTSELRVIKRQLYNIIDRVDRLEKQE